MIPARIDKEMLPHKPGVYQFKDASGRVIYVGKAIDLYHRVSSYFSKSAHDIKTTALVENIESVDTIIVESELEALILEANLIKKYLPQYNISLKDDKDYLYIKVTKEDFPKVVTARRHELKDSLKYFGPFPSSRTVKDTLKALRRVFPWCQTAGGRGWHVGGSNSTNHAQRATRSCFYYHLGLCSGPCAGVIGKDDYRKIIRRFIQFMDGNKEKLVAELYTEMEQASKEQNFEEAARVKKMLSGIAYLTQPNRAQVYLENPNFEADHRVAALEELQRVLHLPTLPHRIECYDISNIQGKESTGSMVVLTEGEIDKSQYRKFKIKITGKPNDVAMHREMMRRRLRHPEWPMPELMLIDGGKGQISGVAEELGARIEELGGLFGLAKRMEWLYGVDGTVVKLPRRSPALHLVQKIRDEAHRFAITYHRKLHQRATLQGLL